MSDLHLDDETLSATIDGEPWPDHLAGCSACVDRRRRLSEAAALVATPAPGAGPGLEEAAVAAAVAAAGQHAAKPRSIPRVLAVAAAIVAVLALSSAPLLFRGGSRPTVAQRAPGAGGGTGFADLGSIDDAAALNSRLRDALGMPAADLGAEVSPEGPADMSSGNLAPGDAQSMAATEGSASDSALADDACLAKARRGLPAKAALAYTARLRWQGRPAVVYVLVDDSKETLSRRAVVTSQDDCSILVVQSF